MNTQLPNELRTALEPYSTVRSIIENLPPRHLQAYIGWVQEPCKPELRAQRIAQTIHRLLETAA
jgi:uncharacterized protein YdeI (YjbR/CyaY-like superfamily)